MRKLAISLVSLDWRRSKDPLMALGHASISASLRQIPNVSVDDVCLDMRQVATSAPNQFDKFCLEAVECIRFNQPDLVCFGAFVWNEPFVQSIGKRLKQSGQRRILIGGPQISYAPPGQLEKLYPFADVFVRGYAEEALGTYATHMQLAKEIKSENGIKSIKGIHHAGSFDMGLQAAVNLLEAPSPFIHNPHDQVYPVGISTWMSL